MKLISLSLNNIRSYVEETIHFDDSLLLVGDIGSGKSTILQSIEFALFGIQRGFNDASHLLRNGSDSASVTLSFKSNESVIEIQRTLAVKRGTTVQDIGYLKIDGEKDSCSPTELTSRISLLLGYAEKPSQIFRYSVYASQEQMKHIILERPESRLNTLRTIFNIDKYKSVIENSGFIARQLRKKIAFFEGQYIDLTDKKLSLAELTKKSNEVKSNLVDVKKNLLVQDDVLNKIDSDVKILSEKMSALNSLESELKSLSSIEIESSSQIAQLVQKQKTLETDIQDLLEKKSKIVVPETRPDLEKLNAKITELSELISRNKLLKSTLDEKISINSKSLESLNADLGMSSDIDSNLEVVSLDLSELNTSIEKLKSEIQEKDSLEKQISDARTNKTKLDVLTNQKQEQLENINHLSSCPTCLQEVSIDHKVGIQKKVELELETMSKEFNIVDISSLETKLSELKLKEKEYLSLIEKKSSLTSKQELLLTQKNDLAKKNNQKDELTNSLELLNKKLSIVSQFDFKTEGDTLKVLELERQKVNDYNLLLQKKNHLIDSSKEKQAQLSGLIKEKSDLETKLETILSKKKDLSSSVSEQLPLKKEFEILSEKLLEQRTLTNQKRISYETLKKEDELLENQIKSLTEEIKVKTAAKQKADWNKHLRSWLNNYYIPLIKEIEKRVLNQIYFEFDDLFQKWFNLLLEDDSITANIDEQFTPKVYQNGYDLDINSLSGGERTSVALAYRLALNKIVTRLNGLKTNDLLILDEPTEGFSTEQLDRVKDVLDELNIPQLIIVSHEAKVGSFVNRTISVEKINGVSRILG